MFRNAGKKIQALIILFFTISCILQGIIGVFIGEELDSVAFTVIYFLVAAFFNWLSLLVLYAFASLVVDTAEIKNILKNQQTTGAVAPQSYPVVNTAPPVAAAPQSYPVVNTAPPVAAAPQAAPSGTCTQCGTQNKAASSFCVSCGSKLS